MAEVRSYWLHGFSMSYPSHGSSDQHTRLILRWRSETSIEERSAMLDMGLSEAIRKKVRGIPNKLIVEFEEVIVDPSIETVRWAKRIMDQI